MNKYEEQTKLWLEKFIVGLNICPFARKELVNNTISYHTELSTEFEKILIKLYDIFISLDADLDIETSLLIIPNLERFDDFVEFIYLAEDFLTSEGYEGVYQLAHFHPDYVFEGVDANEPSNYTNKSPYPVLHIIRESSIEKVRAIYKDIEKIPQRNIELCNSMGVDQIKKLLK